jgi:hypothetical protein
MPIVLACIIAALLIAPALNLIGIRFIWAVLLAAVFAAGLGISCALSVGIL